MIIKAFQVKNTSINNYNMFLLYGENEGFKNQVIHNISKDYEPNILKYEEDELLKNSDIFFSEVNNISLFDNKKVITINRASDKLLSLIESVLEKRFDDLRIIINAGILDRKSKLRAKFEKSKNLVCIPFYADDNTTLARIANNFFRNKKIPISQESINLMVERCRGDRENINNEISKTESFIKYKKKITVDEILKITNLSENYSYSDLSDHCLNKNLKKTMNILNENNYTSEDCIMIIRIMLSKVKRLVMLKENRPLILVPRETPLNMIYIENMLKLSKAGALIAPASPAFYNKPKTLDDNINFIVGRVLDLLGYDSAIFSRWEGSE